MSLADLYERYGIPEDEGQDCVEPEPEKDQETNDEQLYWSCERRGK